MKHTSKLLKAFGAIGMGLFIQLALQSNASAQGTAQEIVADANTVLLDHFNGATLGTVFGPLSYGTSLPGLGQAGQFGPGIYVRYDLPAWYIHGPGSASSTQGTIEMWVKPDQLGRLLNFNWGLTGSYPPAGHVLHLVIRSLSDIFSYGTWNFERCCLPSGLEGTSAIPTGQWTHLAVSWSPTISKLYVNGVVEASMNDNVYPAIAPTVHAYLNYWGDYTFAGPIDEFHISKVQRTDAEILLHATLTPTVIQVVIDIKPGSDPNSINPNSKGVIPVAILTTVAFDATTVDPITVEFGLNGANEKHGKGHIEDVDDDGDMDMVLHFKTQETGIQCDDTEASLTGKTNDGQDIAGTDAIQTVGCNSPKAVVNGEAEESLPESYTLFQNYPNPFNPTTSITFQIKEKGFVTLKVYNVLGKLVLDLVNDTKEAGVYEVEFSAIGGSASGGDAWNLPSGIYFYRIQAGSFVETKKMILMK